MFCKMFEFKWHHESWVKGHSGGSSSDVLRHDVLSEEASNRGLVVQRDVQQLWCVLQLLSVPPLAPRTLLAVETGLAGRHLSHVTAPGVDVMSSDWRGKTFVSSLIWEFCFRDEFTQTPITRQRDGWRRRICCSCSVKRCYINTVYYRSVIVIVNRSLHTTVQTTGWFILAYLRPFNCCYKLLLKCLSSKSSAEYDEDIIYWIIGQLLCWWMNPLLSFLGTHLRIFQLLKCEYFLVSSLVCDSKQIIFGFWESLINIFPQFLTFCRLNSWPMTENMINLHL